MLSAARPRVGHAFVERPDQFKTTGEAPLEGQPTVRRSLRGHDNSAMLHVLHPPPPAAAWIEAAVGIQLTAGQQTSHFPAMPHAMLALRVAQPAGTAGPGASPCGPVMFHTLSTEPVTHAHAGGITALGLLVRPAAAACLLGRSCGAQANLALPWSVLAGAAESARLDDDLRHAASDRARLHALLASFSRCMDDVARTRHDEYARLCAVVGRLGVRAAAQLGLGPRQLQRRCAAVLGVAPKSFQRLVRFRQALGGAVAMVGPRPAWAQVALDAGYYDQAHFLRESRQLAGLSPGALLDVARPDSAWWPLALRRQRPGASPF